MVLPMLIIKEDFQFIKIGKDIILQWMFIRKKKIIIINEEPKLNLIIYKLLKYYINKKLN